jgi:hypothetical protein
MVNTRREFTLEDARKVALLRSYMVLLEKMTTDLWASDGDGSLFPQMVDMLRSLAQQLKELGDGNRNQLTSSSDCSDGYELCQDGVCHVWCS